MDEEEFRALLETYPVVQIIKRFGFSSKTDIKNMLNMAWINDISVNVINKTPIGEDGRKTARSNIKINNPE